MIGAMASTYTDEFKAEVIARASMGEPVKALAREYKMPEATVRYWRDTAKAQPVLAPEKREDLGVLVYEYLVAGLQALIAQAREVAKAEYIQEQSADKLYLLHGTLADKLIALFGAIERGSPEPTATD